MKYHSELFILSENIKPENWDRLYKAILNANGLLGRFELTLKCTNNVVRFFISSDKDLGTLSNNIEGLLFRPTNSSDMDLPDTTAKERFLQFVTGGNLLDLKEKFLTQKNKDLQYAVFKVRSINADKAIIRCNIYLKSTAGNWTKSSKTLTEFPSRLLSIDFTNNPRYLKKTVPNYLNIEKSLHMLSSADVNSVFEVDTFPYFTHNYYLPLPNYEFDRHSLIIGASGSGKSKLISLIVDRLQKISLAMSYRVVVIDPHNSLAQDFGHIQSSKVINFNQESAELFAGAATDISAATELTTTLFKSLMGDQFNSKSDRVLRFSLFVLFTAQSMSLDMLKRFITDIELRNQILEHVKGYVPNNVYHFFGADFNEMRTKYYNEAISPLVSLVDEMQLQPVLVGEGEISLAKTIQDNFLTVFSLNKVSMGEKVVKTVAGLLIQQIFLLAQASAFNQKVLLIIDEVSVVQNPALASILAEARKFNLSVILTQQYFGQIEKDLQDAIFSNVYNYYAFKVSEEDARTIEGNMTIELPKEIIAEAESKGLKERDIRIRMLTDLHPRECLVRVLANGQVVPAVKARTLDAPVSAPVKSQDKLINYSQPKKLPHKFSVQTAQSNQVPVMDQPQTTKPKASKKGHIPPKAPIKAYVSFEDTKPAQAGLFNLSDLLAQHSSSRTKIKKKGSS